jgi:hypothetical protein
MKNVTWDHSKAQKKGTLFITQHMQLVQRINIPLILHNLTELTKILKAIVAPFVLPLASTVPIQDSKHVGHMETRT